MADQTGCPRDQGPIPSLWVIIIIIHALTTSTHSTTLLTTPFILLLSALISDTIALRLKTFSLPRVSANKPDETATTRRSEWSRPSRPPFLQNIEQQLRETRAEFPTDEIKQAIGILRRGGRYDSSHPKLCFWPDRVASGE